MHETAIIYHFYIDEYYASCYSGSIYRISAHCSELMLLPIAKIAPPVGGIVHVGVWLCRWTYWRIALMSWTQTLLGDSNHPPSSSLTRHCLSKSYDSLSCWSWERGGLQIEQWPSIALSGTRTMRGSRTLLIGTAAGPRTPSGPGVNRWGAPGAGIYR